MVFSFTTKGNWAKTQRYLQALSNLDLRKVLEQSGRLGATALAHATPVDSGLAANSWDYKITGSTSSFEIIWFNKDVENGFPVAIMLRHGHGTGTGGFVQGRNYISPAIIPVFDKIEADIRKAVTSIR